VTLVKNWVKKLNELVRRASKRDVWEREHKRGTLSTGFARTVGLLSLCVNCRWGDLLDEKMPVASCGSNKTLGTPTGALANKGP